MARGDLAGAAAALEEAEHIVRHPPPSRWMTWRYGSHCYAALGQLALLNADPGRARRMADQALEMATPTGSRKYESWAWRLKGESATAERVWDEAEQALGRALTIAQTIGHVRQTWMSEVALGRLYTARGRQQDARRHYDAAWTTISGIRVRTQDPGLQIGLDSSPVSREVEGVVKSE